MIGKKKQDESEEYENIQAEIKSAEELNKKLKAELEKLRTEKTDKKS